MPTYTFGFEAEYQTNVQEIAYIMHEKGHTQDTYLHNYTCDCEGCEISYYDDDECERVYEHDSIYNLRIKNDSSCNGELISKVWQSPDDNRVRKLWTDIEQAAINVDTEPGLSAGFHVHVGREHLDLIKRGKLVLALTAWEPILLTLAAGRWPRNRNWNMMLESILHQTFAGLSDDLETEREAGVNHVGAIIKTLRHEEQGSDRVRVTYRTIAREHQEADRHSSMAFSERHPTMEFRLWNSTRSAWRMELWCRLSLLMADPSFVNLMIQKWEPTATIDEFVELIAEYGDNSHAKTYYLAHRQLTYLNNCDNLNITQSTPFTMT